jgi:hypothetical protein
VTYEKPQQRKGLVASYVRWERVGQTDHYRVREVRYTKPSREAPPEPSAGRPQHRPKDRPTRSLIAAERDLFSQT